eukprot:2412516-Amphidinium_carterae.1
MEVGSSLYDRCHDLAVSSGHYKVVSIVPTDVPSRGPKTSGLWVPSEALTEGVGCLTGPRPRRPAAACAHCVAAGGQS